MPVALNGERVGAEAEAALMLPRIDFDLQLQRLPAAESFVDLHGRVHDEFPIRNPVVCHGLLWQQLLDRWVDRRK